MDPNINPHDVELREQDRWLPIANVARLMKNTLPTTAKVSKDAKECMQECVSEFISFISSEASDKCVREKRKTINGEDILYSMHDLGFENYAEVLKIYLAKYREQQALRQEKGETRMSKKQYKAAAAAAAASNATQLQPKEPEQLPMDFSGEHLPLDSENLSSSSSSASNSSGGELKITEHDYHDDDEGSGAGNGVDSKQPGSPRLDEYNEEHQYKEDEGSYEKREGEDAEEDGRSGSASVASNAIGTNQSSASSPEPYYNGYPKKELGKGIKEEDYNYGEFIEDNGMQNGETNGDGMDSLGVDISNASSGQFF